MMKRGSPQLAAVLVGLLHAGGLCGRVRTGPEGFSINLPVAYGRLAEVMREVCGDGIVHGTFQYEHDTEITGAAAATRSDSFPAWKGAGEVCYKVRSQAIAPAHFVASNDVGTITVRFVVAPAGPEQAHISIDAVFVEDNHHGRHPSQGLVETSEFREVAKQLKALADAESRAQADIERQEQSKRAEAQRARQAELQATLAGLNARLETATSAVQKFQERARSLRGRVLARVRPPAAELKESPFSSAATIRLLEGGCTVSVLTRTAYWDRVRTEEGREGWVYYLLMEPAP